jgi:hypothetical protein
LLAEVAVKLINNLNFNKMKLYLLAQDDNSNYDTYDSCIVCAENAEDAKTIAPNGNVYSEPQGKYSDWALSADNISCEEIGEANDKQVRGVVLASFNAG